MLQRIKYGNIDRGWKPSDHHESYQAYSEAVASGCYVCRRIQRDSRPPDGEPEMEGFSISYTYSLLPYFHKKDRLNLGLAKKSKKMVFGGGYPQNTIAVIFEHTGVPAYREIFLWLVPVPPETDKMTGGRVLLGRQSYTEASQRDTCHSDNCNTGSEQCLTLAARWLNTCTAKHTTCERPRPFADRDWQPSRLVYTGNEDDDVLRLCERQMIPPRVRYTTLSHCWGTGIDRKNLKLCNLTAWKREIPKDEVMETFKDAIKVTRKLGLQFIWIDSLCIVQNSEADWLHESQLMSNVYKYSYCNISATAASNDTIGLFCERDPSVDLPVRFQLPKQSLFSPKEMYRSLAKGFRSRRVVEGPYQLCCDVEKLTREIESESPLCRRAWVVQEV